MILQKISAIWLFMLCTMLFASDSNIPMMPIPAEYTLADADYRLREGFTVSISGDPDPRIYKGATRFLRRLSGRTGFFFKQAYITPKDSIQSASLQIKINRPGKIILQEDESYTLEITKHSVLLQAETDLGALHGLETLLQLLDVDRDGYFFPGILIKDRPRFPWRGLLIDVCRHFMPVAVLKRNLDGMAAVKMNVLHWHLTEDQGFRIESKRFPKLHELGSDGFYYTQSQIREVIAYAAERGIRVVPEFDLPGHATSWLVAYPELASAPGPYTIERRWGIMDPTFNPTIEETYTFLDDIFAEMSGLFPDEYMHIGGDENNGKQWDANQQIQEYMRANNIADNHALQAYFNRRLNQILTKYGKRMIGWEEIMHPDMPENIIIQSWQGEKSLVEAAQMGFKAILSRGYYIDLNQATDYHYSNDPLPDSLALSPEQRELIIGGEATMWSEFVSPENIDSRVWPRTAAIAERLWSPGHINDVPDMYRRLKRISFNLEELGLTHEKNYHMMLRRLSNNQDIIPLKTLVDVIEPVKIYRRNKLRTHYSHSPLTRVVDASRPDAAVAREFRNMVTKYIDQRAQDELLSEQLEKWLIAWQNNHAQLRVIINQSPVLEEIASLSKDLSKCAKVGLDAINYIVENESPGDDWQTSASNILTRAKEPRGQAELMIVSAIEELVAYSVKISESDEANQ